MSSLLRKLLCRRRFLALVKHPGGVEIVEEYLYEDGNVREYSRRKPSNLVYIMDNAPGSLHSGSPTSGAGATMTSTSVSTLPTRTAGSITRSRASSPWSTWSPTT